MKNATTRVVIGQIQNVPCKIGVFGGFYEKRPQVGVRLWQKRRGGHSRVHRYATPCQAPVHLRQRWLGQWRLRSNVVVARKDYRQQEPKFREHNHKPVREYRLPLPATRFPRFFDNIDRRRVPPCMPVRR